MDEYGCCEPQDAAVIASMLSEGVPSITFPYSNDRHTAFVITITKPSIIMGTMPFGGSPTTLVSLLLKGSYWFDFHKNKEFHASYVGEKLRLGIPQMQRVSLSC